MNGFCIMLSSRLREHIIQQVEFDLVFEARIIECDRLQSAAYELVVEGESYRQRQKPGITKPADRTGSG
jgi:hypothetical protein